MILLPFGWPEIVAQQWSQVSMGTWLALAYSIVLAAVVAYVIYFKCIGELGATRTAAYNALMPPLAVVIAIVTLRESFTIAQGLGAAVVLGGVALVRFAPPRGSGSEARAYRTCMGRTRGIQLHSRTAMISRQDLDPARFTEEQVRARRQVELTATNRRCDNISSWTRRHTSGGDVARSESIAGTRLQRPRRIYAAPE